MKAFRDNKIILRIGTVCHFRPSDKNISSCEIINPKIAAYDGRDVNCLRCKKTKAYSKYMGSMDYLDVREKLS